MNIEEMDAIFGTTIVPESYMEIEIITLTKKEKLIGLIQSIKRLTFETLSVVIFIIGWALIVGSMAFIAGMFFKMGMA